MTFYTPEHATEVIQDLNRELAAMPARIERARKAVRDFEDTAEERKAQLAAELNAHKAAMDAVSAQQRAEHEARLKELRLLEAGLAIRERALAEEKQRIAAAQLAIEQRSADLSARLHFSGAAGAAR